MTRRVRFTPFSCVRMFVTAGMLASGLVAAPAHAGEVPFSTPPPISTATPIVQAMSVADVDGDGDLDALSASFADDKIAWHENLGLAGWALRTISLTADGAQDVGTADIDRDGDMDVLSTSIIDNRVAWYENTAGNGSAWLTHTITNGAYGAWAVESGDVDGDGDQDVLATAVSASSVYWYENTLGNGSAWVPRTITTNAPTPTSVFAADVDGDGDQDALSASQSDNKVAWHENTLGNGSAWVTRTISTSAQSARTVVAADVDGDGDRDAIASTGDSLTWYDNTAGNGSTWVPRTMATLSDPTALALGDIDGDGDLDALTGSNLQLVWLENASGDGASWTARTVATVGYGVFSAALADLDGDGDPDLASAEANDGEINWYRNESIHRNACFVRQTDISTGPGHNTVIGSLATADVDGDGDTDAMSVQEDDRLSWYENASGNGSSWINRTVATSTGRLYSIVPMDINGDGDMDLVSHPDLVLTRFDNAAGNGSAWNASTVSAFTGFSRNSIDSADIDRDGDPDLLVPDGSNPGVNGVSWFENPGGSGSWPYHLIGSPSGLLASGVDIDGDGDQDVMFVGYDSALAWYENVSGNGSSWALHTIPASGSRNLIPVDVDGDGDQDVFTSMGVISLRWLENTGNGSNWVVRTVATPVYVTFWVDAGDLDGDGDVDGVAIELAPEGLIWYENAAGNGTVWLRHVAATQASDAINVARAADIDSDGDLDLFLDRPFQSIVGWTRNEGGQAVLDLLDQVPATVNNNDVFPILRLTVTHGGRAGDSDLELARLGLLFEEEPGDLLTSAEANALVEELRIYRDVDGNGLFDPGIDTLVASVPKLDLTAGVQIVTFPDGDPNVQVAFGTPRTFFVVAQLTANASQQVPHQFRLTHLALGPSATQAEDRNADIPLTIACAADFSSRLIVATPVDLMGFTVE